MRRSLWVIFLGAIIACTTVVNAEDTNLDCQVKNVTSQQIYDLRPLIRESGADWEVVSQNYTFHLNVCHKILYDKTGLSNVDSFGIWGKREGGNENLKVFSGKFSKEPQLIEGALHLKYESDDHCGTNDYKRSALIVFTCDQTVDGSGAPRFVTSFNDCAFWFEWRTPVACPSKIKGEGMGSWGVFFTISGIALAAYLIGGIAYNRIVYRAAGLNQIPNWEFWRNSGEYIKDMVLIIFAQCPMTRPRRPQGSYMNLPRDEENILIDDDFEEH
ncbi:9064_t:CDS:2 [Acaulospora morrowiae]|uniref:Autophagy-related protein 27 n=1 Tax=Acaulospora morrowiae TaxID=94023 RepID=A0A9N8W9G0_9GLOM|nr:9064_t:CDS:2 [Acaulospora morrowiae]